jgi:hypothetical protein
MATQEKLITYKEYTIDFDTKGGSSVLGRFFRVIVFIPLYILTGKASL